MKTLFLLSFTITGLLFTEYFSHGSNIQSAYVAPGTVIAFAGATCPAGSLAADGTSYLRATYPGLFAAIGTANGTADGTHFNVPDYRGRFIRGTDGATARDPDAAGRTAMNTGGNTGDNVGSIEADDLKSHTHTAGMASGLGSNTTFAKGDTNGAAANSVNASGGNETRPINAYVKYCIKY